MFAPEILRGIGAAALRGLATRMVDTGQVGWISPFAAEGEGLPTSVSVAGHPSAAPVVLSGCRRAMWIKRAATHFAGRSGAASQAFRIVCALINMLACLQPARADPPLDVRGETTQFSVLRTG